MNNKPDERYIISIMKSGLGNQLFMYAAARAFALRTGRELLLDGKRGYQRDRYSRSYRMDRFPIAAREMPEPFRVAPGLRHPRHKLIRFWNKFRPLEKRTYLAESAQVTPEVLRRLVPLKPRVTLWGYWQDEEYFSDFAENIRRELAPPPPAAACADNPDGTMAKQMRESRSVFVHLRRVRYPVLLASGYYQEAIDRVSACLEKPRFFVFGDAPDWARENLDFRRAPVSYVTHNNDNEIADLWLMTQCRHSIIANSSYSWWGAWLGAGQGLEEGRLVFAPENPGMPKKYPSGWTLIS
ncbi:MAG: alpha-1,2-fucosyltransferase [Opitutaceae bacterium]|jgi:hypothetical protein|nr:alpha-1,2-fucosyltransferase [Opitutaceae bacterium]